MGTVNTNIRIDELITQFELMKEQLAAASPVSVSLTGTSGNLDADVFDHMCAAVKNGSPVTVKVTNGTTSTWLGFYASLTEGEEYNTIIFGTQGNEDSLSIVDGDWELM